MNNPNGLFQTFTVNHLLSSKGRTVWHVRPHETVFAALQLMAAKNVGAVVVIDEDKLTGILSERDYARKVTLLGKSSKTTPVYEIMTTKVVTVGPDHTIGECMEKMTFHRIRHLPVVDGDRVIGLISIGDLVKAFIMQQAFFLEQLENYRGGKHGVAP
ncbi:MAG: CBS domain-containing protein [Anaerolineales bacterium]|nr:CBS domain-containing protein [Anaerolineales bacterium]